MRVDGSSLQGENPLEPRKVPRFPGYFKMLGPGIVWMALAQGSGELIWWPYLVAKYGLGFVFILIPACLVQVPLLYNVGQYTVLTGESIFQGFFRVHRHYLLFLWVLFIVHFLWFGAFASAGATALVELTGLPPQEWFPTDVDPRPYQRLAWAYFMIAGFAGAVLLSKVVYTLIERIMWLVATVTMVGLLAACFHPEVSSQIGPFAKALVMPAGLSQPFDTGEDLTRLLTAVTFAGLGGFWLLFYSYWVREKGCGMARYVGRVTGLSGKKEEISDRAFRPIPTEESADRMGKWRKFLLFDGLVGVIGNILTTLMTCLLAFALLHPQGLWPEGEQLAVVQSEFFARSWGAWGRAVFLVVAAAFLADSWIATADSVARTHTDCSRLLSRSLSSISTRRLYGIYFVILTVLTSVTMPLAQPGTLILLTGVIGVVATVAYSFGLLALNLKMRNWLGDLGPSRLATGTLLFSALVYLGLAVSYFWVLLG